MCQPEGMPLVYDLETQPIKKEGEQEKEKRLLWAHTRSCIKEV